MAALSRDELIAILAEIVQAPRARSSQARTTDGLKAAEMLAKMCGWNQPERVNVQGVEVKVDAALLSSTSGLRAASRASADKRPWMESPIGANRPSPRVVELPRVLVVRIRLESFDHRFASLAMARTMRARACARSANSFSSPV